MFSKVYDDSRTEYSRRYFKFYQTTDNPSQIATPKYDSSWDNEIASCKRVFNWPKDALVTIRYNADGIMDLPWFVGNGTFASNRFCDIAWEIGADQVQLLPVKIELDGLDISQAHECYSVVNWLREVDCLHRDLAGFGTHSKYGFKRAQHFVVDESLIPNDAIVFRVKYKGSAVVVREDFLETLALNEITGWNTMRIEAG